MEVVATTGAISRAKLESNHHHKQNNILFLQDRGPSCHPTNSVRALKEKLSHSLDLFTPSLPGVFQLCPRKDNLPTRNPVSTNSKGLFRDLWQFSASQIYIYE